MGDLVATEKQKMLAGELYIATGEELAADARRVADWMDRYNASIARTQREHATLLREMQAEVVTIGDGTQVGPGVQILTADHPRDQVQRRAGLKLGRPVHIGANVWIGAAAIILPGVAVADDAIIGAGAVVTRDVRPGATVVGNPAKERPA
jgi:maltose O-acetyltransferase